MANPTFSYTDSDSVTTTIEFPRGSFQGDVPYDVPNQKSDFSQQGVKLTQVDGLNYEMFPLTVQVPAATQAGNLADAAKFKSFFSDIVNFSKRVFTYTDISSVAHTVQLENDDVLNPTNDFVSYRQHSILMREFK